MYDVQLGKYPGANTRPDTTCPSGPLTNVFYHHVILIYHVGYLTTGQYPSSPRSKQV